MADAMIALEHVTSGYAGDLPVVHDVSATFGKGTITTLVGPNGAGKSTLLRTIYGLTRFLGGTIRLAGEQIQGLQPWEQVKRGLGFVPQGRCNFPAMTVWENLELGAYTLPASRTREAIDAMTARFPVLRDKAAQLAGNLSGGEQQVLEMAMVLMLEPRVLLLDEPTLGLSPKWHDEIFRVIRALCDGGMTVVMVEQNVRGGLSISDCAIVMEQGRVVMDGTAGEILGNPRIKSIYLGGTLEEDDRLSNAGQA